MAGTNSAGNNRKSREEHIRTGTFRKDRHADLKNPEPLPGRPEQVATFDEIEQAEWDRVVASLEQSQSLTQVDGHSLYQYVRLFAETERVAKFQSEMAGSLEILEENVGGLKGAELIELFRQIVILRQLISKATDQLRSGRMAIRQYLVEFGLTTASRGRIKLPPKPAEVDEFSVFQKARKVS